MTTCLLLAGSFALAFAQRPGQAVFDTRIELSADPVLFLHRVSAVWSSAGDLGHVQSGQFVGYLFPMAPWFAFVHWVGLPLWVGQRLWLGGLIALAAWGILRLLDDLYSPRRGVAHLVAGAVYAANPYVAVWMTRGSAALLAYAAVPWLLLAVHRGMLEPRRWRWPAAIGLLLAASGAGVNAAVVVWILPAPVALMLYEAVVLRRGGSALGSFSWRAAVCALLGSAWWAIPLLIQSRYGTDFLSFTELPSSVWATPTMAESVRLLGYWLLYLGLGGTSVVGLASVYLFSPTVIVATFLVPLFAVAGLRWTRRWPYAPFFCLLAVGALVAMAAGFPGGTPLHSVLMSAYYDLEPLRFLRTSYKAAPLLATALACLAGPALRAVALRVRTSGLSRTQRRIAAGGLAAAATVVIVLYALPIFEGRAIDRAQAYGSVPAPWRDAIADAQRTTPADQRILLLPGALFSSYRWGSTVTSIGTALSNRPLLVRELVPYAHPRSAGLLAAVDDLVQQDRLVPGQLRSLLRLMAVGTVLVNADSLPVQSGSLDPAGVSEALRHQDGLGRPTARYGSPRTYRPAPGHGGAPVRLPELRAYRLSSRPRGIVRVDPLRGATVLDGNADGIAELAAVGRLDPERALFLAGDLDRKALAQQVHAGAQLVFTDSNRRRVLEPDLLRANQGPTVGPDDPLPRDFPTDVLFGPRGTQSQTVTRLKGLTYVRSPLDRGLPIFPQHRAYTAVDGRLDTVWLGSSVSSSARRYFELGFGRPRTIGTIRLYARGAGAVAVSVDNGPERRFLVHGGWNALSLGALTARKLRVRLPSPVGPAGIAELRMPGPAVSESLRLPTDLAAAARGLDLGHSGLSVLLTRTTADFPYDGPAAARDAETGLDRVVTLPVTRGFGIGGWASVNPTTSDSQLDRLAGMTGAWSVTSSNRFEDLPGRRASSAFDGDVSTAWIGAWRPGRRAWVAVRGPHETVVRRLTFAPGPAEYAAPTRIEVSTPGGGGASARVGDRGVAVLRRPVRGRTVRISVLAAHREARAPGRPPAVAIGEIAIPGLRPPPVRRSGAFTTRCGALTVTSGGATATARVAGTLAALDAGEPLRLAGCGAHRRIGLPAGASHVIASPGAVMRPDHLELAAPAPVPLPPTSTPGTVSVAGSGDSGTPNKVRLRLEHPGWLVYGESYSSGWGAWCRGDSGGERSLGPPVPIDGFANGWRIRADCREARFAFAPQRFADVGYAISAVAGLGMLVLVLLPLRRRARAAALAAGDGRTAWLGWQRPLAAPPFDPVRRVRWSLALPAGVLSGAIGWFCFGARGGIMVGLAMAVLLMAGVNIRRLIAIAAVALLALPLLYLVEPAPRPSGLSFTYASHYIAAHWVAVAAMLCVAGVGVLGAVEVASAVRRRARAPTGEPRPRDADADELPDTSADAPIMP